MKPALRAFDRVVVIAGDPEAARAFDAHLRERRAAFGPTVLTATFPVDRCAPPPDWPGDAAGWVRLQAHARAAEDALASGARSLLVLEAAVRFEPDVTQRVSTVLAAAGPWRVLALAPVRPGAPLAYAVSATALPDLARALRRGGGDGVVERLLTLRGRPQATTETVVRTAPDVDPAEVPVVVVVGLLGAGVGLVGDALRGLGLEPGDPAALRATCDEAFPVASAARALPPGEVTARLELVVREAQAAAGARGTLALVAHPTLASLADELERVAGDAVRVVCVERPREAATASFAARSGLEAAVVARRQEGLARDLAALLARVDHVSVSLDAVRADPRVALERVCKHLSYAPRTAAIQAVSDAFGPRSP